MAEDMDSGAKKEFNPDYRIVEGSLIGHTPGMIFARFQLDGREEACLSRPHRIYLNGERVKSREVRTKERLKTYIDQNLMGKKLSMEVFPNTKMTESVTPEYKTIEGDTVHPKFYANCIWISGPPPPEDGRRPSRQPKRTEGEAEDKAASEAASNPRLELAVEEQVGAMVYHNASGQGYIAFSPPSGGGPEEYARFHMRDFFVDGHPIQQKTYHSWDLEKKMEVTFSAIRLDSPFVSREMTANYLCVAAWIGAKPTEDKLRMSMQKTTYFAGAMSHLVDARTGIMEANNKFVLFDATCFMVNGTSLDLTNENALTAALQLGEPIYCYAKKVAPQEMEGKWVTYKAEHVWKGRKAIGLASALTKQKSESAEDMSVCAVDEEDGEDGKKGPRRCALPQPSAATDSNVTGRIVELPSVQHGIIELSSSGEKCLFPRSRVFIQGEKLKGRDILHNHVKVGDELAFDMVRADNNESKGEYAWVALVVWPAQEPRPTPESISQIEFCDASRGKIVKFGERSKSDGMVCGIAIITTPKTSSGEKAYFAREQTYVYGASMARADLFHLLKEGDKVFLVVKKISDQSLINELNARFGQPIMYRATCLWVGPVPPRIKESPEIFSVSGHPRGSGGVDSYLQKRKLDLNSFNRLIRGELPPKPYEHSDRAVLVLEEEVIARVVELVNPAVQNGPCNQGFLLIESGRYQHSRILFNSCNVRIFGHSLSTKANLMYLVKGDEKFNVKLRAEPQKPSEPVHVNTAWIGPKKFSAPDEGTQPFLDFLDAHGIASIDSFKAIVAGNCAPKPFFPLPAETQLARVSYLYEPKDPLRLGIGSGSLYGILKIYQGSQEKKDAIFVRNSVYLWDVNLTGGDMSYLIHEGTKVKCEVSEISSGKQKRMWQTRLGSKNIPNYLAQIVYIGGGRPKGNDPALAIKNELDRNVNLVQWLNKRKFDTSFFNDLLRGKIRPRQEEPPPASQKPHRPPEPADPRMRMQANSYDDAGKGGGGRPGPFPWGHPHPNHALPPSMHSGGGRGFSTEGPLHDNNVWDSKEGSPMQWRHEEDFLLERRRRRPEPAQPQRLRSASPFGGGGGDDELENPIMAQAKAMLSRVMACRTPDDPNNADIVRDVGDARLAQFVSKTLERAVAAYKIRQSENARPPGCAVVDVGPIAPPSRAKTQSGDMFSLNESQGSRDGGGGRAVRSGGGLIGLSKPLLESFAEDSGGLAGWNNSNTLFPLPHGGGGGGGVRLPMRRESPVEFSHGTHFMEPPYKRKSNLEQTWRNYDGAGGEAGGRFN